MIPLIEKQCIDTASDGSHDPDFKIATGSWVISSHDREFRIHGQCPVDGDPDTLDPYRDASCPRRIELICFNEVPQEVQ